MIAFSNIVPFLVISCGVASVAQSNKNWQSIHPNLEFVQEAPYSLRRTDERRSLSYFEDTFVDGMETAYNQYAQAWRLIGLYTDCNVAAEERRRLEDGDEAADEEQNEDEANDGEEEGQQDEEQQDEEQQQEEEEEVQEEEQDGFQCKRYLLWGAYVDLEYEGNGLSEYQIYNVEEKKWDKSACFAGKSDRCVKMDCHQRRSNFQTLGYFRQSNPVEFLQVLAERQGSCTWNNSLSNSIENSINWLPQGCTQTEIKVKNQNGRAAYVYFDLKPTGNAGIDIGLYTDGKCSMEYLGEETTASDVVSAYTGESVNVEQTMDYLNKALDTFKVCSPCRTFDFKYNPNNQNNENNEEEGDGNDANDGNNEDPNNSNFICNDAAGNEGTNMCMDFAQNTEISAATESDIFTASQQGTIRRTYSAADAVENWWDAWGFLLISALVFLLGLVCFCSVAVKRRRVTGDRTTPLIGR